MYDAYVCLRDLKSIGTPGGTFEWNAWRTRDLNDEQADPADICALAANQFLLAPGTYRATISCPAYTVEEHQARLFNVTANTVLLLGTSEFIYGSIYATNRSFVVGRFTVEAAQTLEVQHRCDATKVDDGFGTAAGFGDEIYTTVELWREIPEE